MDELPEPTPRRVAPRRAHALIAVALLVAATFAAVQTVHALNRIPNSPAGFEDWGPGLRSICLVLALALLALATGGLRGSLRPMRVASIVTLLCVTTVLTGILLGPVMGLSAVLLANGVVLLVPAAFFAVATVRFAWTAWRGRRTTGPAMVGGYLAAVGFALSVHLSLCFSKAMALGWAYAMD